MKISGHQIEFGYEAIAAWPFAYWAHTQGLLTSTESGPDTDCLYWYSPHHEIRTDERGWHNMANAGDLPNLWIHKPILDKRQWIPPPLKEHFARNAITFDKPTVVICNRVNIEWGREAINYIDLGTLHSLCAMLVPKYTVVYVNVLGRPELEDTAKAIDIGDYAMLREEFPSVRIIHDLVDGGSFNETQCRVFAGCKRFITMNGGHSILCSYFGGENIIYSRECKELWPNINSFYNWYADLGGAAIKVVNSHEALLEMVRIKWVDDAPLINILVRCHDREMGLKRLYHGLAGQTHKNWRVIASHDTDATWRYLCSYPFEKVRVRPDAVGSKPPGAEYGRALPSNLYLNALMERVNDGYIMFMDDDDAFADPGALARIASQVGQDRLLLWRTNMGNGRKVPSNENWGKIVAGDISGITFAFHHSHKHLAQWEPWRRGDYRVIKRLSEGLKTRWTDQINTIIRRDPPGRMSAAYMAERAIAHKQRIKEINAAVQATRALRAQGAVGFQDDRVGPSIGGREDRIDAR